MSAEPIHMPLVFTSRSPWPLINSHPYAGIPADLLAAAGMVDICWARIGPPQHPHYCGRPRDEHDPRPFDHLMRDDEAIVRHGRAQTKRLMRRHDVKRAAPPRRWTFSPDGMRRDHELFVNDDWRPR